MQRRADPAVALGILFLVVGLLALAGQFVRVPELAFWSYGWPVFVILPGLAMIAVGLTVAGLSGFTIPGAMVTLTGLILAFQSTFDAYQTWAYAWTLVAPFGAGVGIALQGVARKASGQVRAGLRTMWVGFWLFLGFAIFFEGIIRLSQINLGPIDKVALPAVLIALGVILLLRRIVPARR